MNEPAREPLYTSNPDPVHTRTIIIYWDPGSNFQVETTGTWLDWEVEAALDDVNLGRLIDAIDELRTASQLIVVTHQKRTMEIADALYGVSMRGDGVTQVVGQRLRDRDPVSA